MSNKFKAILALGILTVLTACAQQEEPMQEPMVMEEPVMEKY